MPNFTSWLDGNAEQISAKRRAARAWRRITRNPVEIIIIRDGVGELPAQKVRIEAQPASGGQESDLPVGSITMSGMIVFGIRDHPFLEDTDIQRMDRFVYNDLMYLVEGVLTPPGQVQAIGRVTTG